MEVVLVRHGETDCILGEKGKLDYGAGNLANCDYEIYEIKKKLSR